MPNHTHTHPTLTAMQQLRESILDNLADTLPDPAFSAFDFEPEMALVAALGTVLANADALVAYL